MLEIPTLLPHNHKELVLPLGEKVAQMDDVFVLIGGDLNSSLAWNFVLGTKVARLLKVLELIQMPAVLRMREMPFSSLNKASPTLQTDWCLGLEKTVVHESAVATEMGML
ncbi:hypothetical protein GH714_020770 [Hevea brasiliensis]|uniref:Uncharacterized protein n=1 Tax=Hevea brasiliensis TaxID=3981 RepID=A0A6A6LKY3_HEVBR|nr:hypothetical protein GH714_020770 [Hevea brasiliensis]